MLSPILHLTTLAILATSTIALPAQHAFSSNGDGLLQPIENKLDPLRHLSAISPFFVPTEEPTPLPPSCNITAATILCRHSSILGNDDEFELTMQPFIKKISKLDKAAFPSNKRHPWYFLRNWKTPIVEDKLEVLSDNGKRDAKVLGSYIRKQYHHLFPPERNHTDPDVDESEEHVERPPKNPKHKKPGPPYKVWTASSARDIETAQAYIQGAFPRHQAGPDGEGDGINVQLIEVPNHLKDWAKSLTPHKACDAFEKESSLPPAETWLNVYGPRVIQRLKDIIPDVASELVPMDILAMQELCGYETIATGSSPFCSVFTDDEWLDVEYYFDIRFHYMMGYGNPLSPYLGLPWVQTASHLLAGEVEHEEEGAFGGASEEFKGKKKGKKGKRPLPSPRLPPNETHTQLLHTFFTHRESPAFVATFLNLYNGTKNPSPSSFSGLGLPTVGGVEISTTHRVDPRPWRTSELVPFLGHITIERLHSDAQNAEGDYIRVLVNGKMERLPGCEDGPGGTCGWDSWKQYIQDRRDIFHGFESVCNGTSNP